MKRWNGWGEDTRETTLTEYAQRFLRERAGNPDPAKDAGLEQALAGVPSTRMPELPSDCGTVSTDPETRLRHARGQSFPDWLALRHGRAGLYPDGVAFPETTEQVESLVGEGEQQGILLIPYGGGTSVVGHLSVPETDKPVLTVDMGRMNRLLHLDRESGLARFGAGVAGPDLEKQLQAEGYTLGHFPQSFEYSTLGGWIAARSSGQQSMHYGRIEQLFAGGEMVTPGGRLTIPTLPASSAGPDLRHWVMGSEGRLGIVTEATVRVRPVPECEHFHAVFFPSWQQGQAAVRDMAQARLGLSMLRLSNASETETQLGLVGESAGLRWLQRYLALRGMGTGQCMLVMGVTGTKGEVRALKRSALSLARRHEGVHTGRAIGKAWEKSRFHGPYLRNALWEAGYGVDTVETSVDWPHVSATMQAMERSAQEAMAEFGERLHAFTHLSHVYPQGSSLYSTFVFRADPDAEVALERWRKLKSRVSEAIVACGGTISHQHGVGIDHAPYLEKEKGELGLGLIDAALTRADPRAFMNPGKLLDSGHVFHPLAPTVKQEKAEGEDLETSDKR